MNFRHVTLTCILVLSLACGFAGTPSQIGAPGEPVFPRENDGATACDHVTDDYVSIGGSYYVEGGKADGSGSEYTGYADITQIARNCFMIEWHIDDGPTRLGFITMDGDALSGTWYEGELSGEFSGVATPDGLKISLSWGTTGGDPAEYREELSFGVVG